MGLRLVRAARPQPALLEKGVPHLRAQLRDLAEALHQEVTGGRDRRLRSVDPLLQVAEREGPQLEGLAREGRLGAVPAVPDPVRERLQSGLPGEHRPGLPLLLVGQVQVLEGLQVEGREHLVFELGGELLLPLDGLQDDRLPVGDPVPQLPGLESVADGHLVEVPGPLLPIAGDEGHGGAARGQVQDGMGSLEADLGVPGAEPGVEGGRGGDGQDSARTRALCCHHPAARAKGRSARASPPGSSRGTRRRPTGTAARARPSSASSPAWAGRASARPSASPCGCRGRRRAARPAGRAGT